MSSRYCDVVTFVVFSKHFHLRICQKHRYQFRSFMLFSTQKLTESVSCIVTLNMKTLIFFVIYVSLQVFVYEAQALNVIGPKQCSLNNIKRSDLTDDKDASAKIRDRFLSEHEAGGKTFLSYKKYR